MKSVMAYLKVRVEFKHPTLGVTMEVPAMTCIRVNPNTGFAYLGAYSKYLERSEYTIVN